MSVSRSLTFLWTPISLSASILVVLATAGFCFVAWRRSGYRASFGMLELLRLALVIAAAIMLNQPEWVEEFRPTERPTIVVLVDASPSMDTRDAVQPGKPGSTPRTRREAVAALIDPKTWASLHERMNVVISRSPPRNRDTAATCTHRWPRRKRRSPT